MQWAAAAESQAAAIAQVLELGRLDNLENHQN
jgi:hypothetical protein